MKCTAIIKRALRLRDEVRDDPSCAGRKGAHVMSDFREFDPLRVAADDLSDAYGFRVVRQPDQLRQPGSASAQSRRLV